MSPYCTRPPAPARSGRSGSCEDQAPGLEWATPMPHMRPALRACLPLLGLFSLACQAEAPPTARRFELPTMGTVGSVQIVADSLSAAAAATRALARFAFVDSLMSNWTTTSEVARLKARFVIKDADASLRGAA